MYSYTSVDVGVGTHDTQHTNNERTHRYINVDGTYTYVFTAVWVTSYTQTLFRITFTITICFASKLAKACFCF